ncbi:MAG: response regulator transcription factor [Granulosicoccaceae bacterium]|jgi:two-component system response regulator RegA
MNTRIKEVLIVDDDVAFCDTLAHTLERRGLQVYKANDSACALSLAQQHAPAHAVIDLCIGEESGLQLVAQLTAAQPAMRLVILTGFASIATAVEAIKLGATHYLTKPAAVEDILAALQRDSGDASIATEPQPMSVKRLEWEHIQKVLSEHDQNISAAARALGMHRRTLQRKLQKRPMRQ